MSICIYLYAKQLPINQKMSLYSYNLLIKNLSRLKK